jgi:hypothetical protein
MFTQPINWGVLVVAVLICLATAAPAGAVGYWNMPTSFSQWWGYGVGPGYHAPMVLGPVTARGLVRPYMEIRLPCAPHPACSSGCGCQDTQSLMESQVLPDAAPLPSPQPAAAYPVNSRPAEFVLQ